MKSRGECVGDQQAGITMSTGEACVYTHKLLFLFRCSHPTSCCSVAEVMSVLFFHTMKYRPEDPRNPNNDRFILSKVSHMFQYISDYWGWNVSSTWMLMHHHLRHLTDSRRSESHQAPASFWHFSSGSRGSCAVRRVGWDGLPEGKWAPQPPQSWLYPGRTPCASEVTFRPGGSSGSESSYFVCVCVFWPPKARLQIHKHAWNVSVCNRSSSLWMWPLDPWVKAWEPPVEWPTLENTLTRPGNKKKHTLGLMGLGLTLRFSCVSNDGRVLTSIAAQLLLTWTEWTCAWTNTVLTPGALDKTVSGSPDTQWVSSTDLWSVSFSDQKKWANLFPDLRPERVNVVISSKRNVWNSTWCSEYLIILNIVISEHVNKPVANSFSWMLAGSHCRSVHMCRLCSNAL